MWQYYDDGKTERHKSWQCDCISTVAITDNRGSPRFKVAQDKSLKQAPYDGYSTMTFQNDGLWAKTS